MLPNRLLSVTATGILAGLVAVWFLPYEAKIMTIIAGAICIGCLGFAVFSWIEEKRSSRYDLKRLLTVHENALDEEFEPEEVPPDASVYCPYCGDPFPQQLLICPRCKR